MVNKKQTTKSSSKIKNKGSKNSSFNKNNKGNSSINSSYTTSTTNQPRNHLIKDATSPYSFTFQQYGKTKAITVNQTPDEDTWPGGALWDIGVLLAKVMIMINIPPPPSSSTNPYKTKQQPLFIPRLLAPGIWPSNNSWKDCTILELGCGVGLTGLVASSLGARGTILSDLDVVINKVTRPNVEMNKSVLFSNTGEQKKSKHKIVAMPLCWGKEDDEEACAKVLEEMNAGKKGSASVSLKRKKKKNTALFPTDNSASADASVKSSPTIPLADQNNNDDISACKVSLTKSQKPNIILIGDVAYQHKPGAPSHFDILLSTVLKFTDAEETVVVFGTRMRMPASTDLLDMFHHYFDEVVQPPIEAHEVDEAFRGDQLGRRHNITIHVFKLKSQM